MARKHFGLMILLTVAVLAGSAVAQKNNEIAGAIGRSFISDQTVTGGSTVHFGDGLTYEANFSHRFINLGAFSIAAEIPFVIDPKNKLQYNTNVVPSAFKSYFLTPSARVNLFPDMAFSPWVSAGAGFAHFTPSSTLEFGGANPGSSRTTSVFQVGVGLDVAVISNLKIRGEFRDFNSGEPPINVNSGKRYNNLYAAAGLVLSF